MKDFKKFAWLVGIFLVAYFIPLGNSKVSNAILEAFRLLQWYAVNHTLACVVPAMFIAGAISTFLSQASVMRYLGPKSNRFMAYSVASVSGMVLAVCSCSVLPMFAGIYAMGAGLGPASAFLYSGPAINVMAIFLSARVLGTDIGITRAVGAIVFAFIIGLIMAVIFKRSEQKRMEIAMQNPEPPPSPRPLWKTSLYFLCLILFLVFSDWYNTNDVTITAKDGTVIEANIRYSTQDTIDIQKYEADGKLSPDVLRFNRADLKDVKPVQNLTMTIHGMKWYLAGAMGLALLVMVWRWFSRDEVKEWMQATWDFGLMIVPLLFGGVFLTGFIGALMPEKYVAAFVGGNGLLSNFVASFAGMLWYFATLTEIPIVEMLMRLGMGKGPALALLLAGPALSLPSILVINKIIGWRKTFMFCLLAVGMSTLVGYVFGIIAQ
ncbi:MAG: permease [Lentisphaerae bacterium RIFOXYA12_FULL_48_11]|nr:MAG: permease [Lentisphaerae bacterium RIFOXYA12_FULL_48_11]